FLDIYRRAISLEFPSIHIFINTPQWHYAFTKRNCVAQSARPGALVGFFMSFSASAICDAVLSKNLRPK
ncbi:hypothetical protein ALC60_01915, partial [Trachymyrmex zeteki]